MLDAFDNVLRCFNFILMVIAMAFISALLNTTNHNSSRVNFCMFAVAYGITTDSFYGLIANFWQPLAMPIILAVLDFLNFVFMLTAGSVLASGIRAHSCKNEAYRNGNSIIQGSENRCRMSQAAVAFLFFSMGVFLAKLIMSVINVFSNGAFSTSSFNPRSSRRNKQQPSGVPNISEVWS